MTAVANNPGEFSLGAANAETGWIPLDDTIEDIAFNITGTFVGTITMRVSNQSDTTKTRYSTVTTYTTTQAPLGIPREIGRFVNFVMTAYTSGTAYVGFSKGKSPNGVLVNLSPQGTSSSPTGEF